jgi:hypothetical protein
MKMMNRKKWVGMLVLAFIFCGVLTSCWSTGNAREVVPVTAVTLQRVRSTIMSDLPMSIFVDNTPYELGNSETTSILVNNGEHMVYAVLGEVESKSVRFTANSRTIVVNVSAKDHLIGHTELIIEVGEAK